MKRPLIEAILKEMKDEKIQKLNNLKDKELRQVRERILRDIISDINIKIEVSEDLVDWFKTKCKEEILYPDTGLAEILYMIQSVATPDGRDDFMNLMLKSVNPHKDTEYNRILRGYAKQMEDVRNEYLKLKDNIVGMNDEQIIDYLVSIGIEIKVEVEQNPKKKHKINIDILK